MSDVIPINLAIEGQLDEAVLKVILWQSGIPFAICSCYMREGFGYLKKQIRAFNNAAKGTPYLVLTDLDTYKCAPLLIEKWLPSHKHQNLIFRIAVRGVEAWLLAHRQAIADFLGINVRKIPEYPDNIENPKQFLINLARKSRKRRLKDAIIPRPGSTATIGPDYNNIMSLFVGNDWDVNEAVGNSPSLKRAFNEIASFSPIYREVN